MSTEKASLSQSRIRRVKGLTFADAYGLGLLAKSPGEAERGEIFQYLSPGAKQIAGTVVSSRPVVSSRGPNKKQKKTRIAAKKK